MNSCFSRPIVKIGVCIVVIFCAMTALLSSCGPSPSYVRFRLYSQRYYADVADGCDALLAASNITSDKRKIAGDDRSLPPVLRDLHPAYVLVSTNSVGLRIKTRLGPYWVGWIQSDLDRTTWQLKINAEGLSRVLFSRQQPPKLEGGVSQ
jgi:hypothetical protein